MTSKSEKTAHEARNEASRGVGYQVYLLPEKGFIHSVHLPARPSGKYVLTLNEGTEKTDVLRIEAENGKWIAHCLGSACFVSSDLEADTRADLLEWPLLSIETDGKKCCLYTEHSGSTCFHNHRLLKSEITIGRSEENDIVCKSYFVSRNHAILRKDADGWEVIDQNSTNGVFVNGERVSSARLKLEDTVFIMGLRLILGAGFLSVNDDGEKLSFHPDAFRPLDSAQSLFRGASSERAAPQEGSGLFNRLPRRRLALEVPELIVEGPPMSMNNSQVPLALRMGGTAISSGKAALSGNYVMLFSSLLFPILSQKYTDHQKADYEANRHTKYLEYLEKRRVEILAEKKREETILRQNYPPLNTLLRYPTEKTHLWERRKIDDDFLHMRLGSGQRPLLAEIQYPEKSFQLDTDDLETAMYRLVETPFCLEDAPIMADIVTNPVCGVTGPARLCRDLIRRLILQMTILHSYDEVKTVFLMEPEDLAQFDFVRFLPHAWSDERNQRFIATDVGEAIQLGKYLKELLNPDSQNPGSGGSKGWQKDRPYYVFFAFSKKLFDSLEVLKDVMQEGNGQGVTVITLFDDIPKECSLLFTMNPGGEHSVTYLHDLERADEVFRLDPYSKADAEESMHILANTSLKTLTESYTLPKTLSFLEMFGVGRVEHLNPLKRWAESNPTKTLSTPIGVGTDGAIFNLDLHQKYQGPHGLVAGMTGSGKSEFLITYILSLAINYSPDEVAFVLIDYKGGGLAGAFDDPAKGIHLPHLVGTITNLDGGATHRSMASIQSELTRRQRVFNEAKSISDEGTMDIYLYQKLYRAGVVKEPMPHLFIISDEFAELKTQEPEFMEALISAARIGRSLGIHLILATQKPSGVVNDQIRSNTKFRACLKVQDKSDSQDMLMRPEAAGLKETGRFYLQVGYNEYFALGQSAWSGAAYEPQDTVIVNLDDSVQALDMAGQTQVEKKPKVERAAAQGSQLMAVVRLLSHLAEEQHITPKSLWQPALPALLADDDPRLPRSGAERLQVSVALVDDPERQQQFPFLWDFARCRNLLIAGGAGSGKTSLIQSILMTLVSRCTAEEFQFYMLDYSSRMFKAYRNLPHCGGVLYEEDSEELDNFFKLINGIISQRKKLFTELEVDNFEAARALRPLPLVLVVIDNAAAIKSTKIGEAHFHKLNTYMKDCASYGVKYLLTASRPGELSTQILNTMEERLALHLKDKYEFGDTLNCKVNYQPPDRPGRGLVCIDGRPLEMQSVMYRPELDETERVQQQKQTLNEIERRSEGPTARKMPVMREDAEYADFIGQFNPGRIPLGFSLQTSRLIALPLKQMSALSVYFGNPRGVVPVMENLLHAASRERMELWLVRRAEHSVFSDEKGGVDLSFCPAAQSFGSDAASVKAFWTELSSVEVARGETLKAFCAEEGLDIKQADIVKKSYAYMQAQTRPIMILIESMADLCSEADAVTGMVLDRLFSGAHKRNIYVVAGFEPDDKPRAGGSFVYTNFNPDENCLLMGGQLQKQYLVSLPPDGGEAFQALLPYNRGLIRYREKYHPFLMPCGELPKDEEDEDDASIF